MGGREKDGKFGPPRSEKGGGWMMKRKGGKKTGSPNVL